MAMLVKLLALPLPLYVGRGEEGEGVRYEEPPAGGDDDSLLHVLGGAWEAASSRRLRG